MSPAPDCRETDLVLARFLDGEPEPTGTAGAAALEPALSRHLEGCSACRTALRRARRLDALLAQHSGVRVSDAQADRLLGAVAAPVQPRRTAAAAAGILLAGGVLTGAIAGFWLGQAADSAPPRAEVRPAGSAGPAEPAATAGVGAGTGQAGGRSETLALPSPRRSRDRTGEHRTAPTAAMVLAGQEPEDGTLVAALVGMGLRHLALAAAPVAAPPSGWLELRHAAQRLAEGSRVAAGLALLSSADRRDHAELDRFLAGAEDGPVLRELLAAARGRSGFLQRLAGRLDAELPAPPDLRLAARLGDPRIDRILRRRVRRDPAEARSIAEGLVEVRERPGRVDLLLDIWAAERSDPADLRRWFRALPGSATATLIAAARETNRTERRVHAITALGWRGDPGALPFLLEQIEGRHHESALAAGLAVGRLPAPRVEDRVRARLEHSQRPHVLLAALCGMRSPWPRLRLPSAGLSREETDFLAAGAFTAEQFPIACRLCRRRSFATH